MVKVLYLADAPFIHTRRWLQHFAARGYECEVISFRPAEVPGVRVTHVSGFEALGKARYLLHAPRVTRLIKEARPDLLHAIHLTSYGFLASLSGAHPYLLSVIGTDILEAPRLTPLHAWLTRRGIAGADEVTATGPRLAAATRPWMRPGKDVHVVPFGVELERFRPRPRQARQVVTIGTVARLSPEKGIEHLLDAYADLRRKYGDRVRLRIAGDTTPEPGGPERRRLEVRARQLGIEAAAFEGWLEHAALPAFLQDLDIFVLPSVYEGFGVAAVEAAAMELPVVASDVYGIPDVVVDGETGLLVPARDASALADAIAALVEDGKRRLALGRAGREYVAERYDWDKNAAAMERLYEQMAGAGAGPRDDGRG